MPSLDKETRDMILESLRDYADRKLTDAHLLTFDREDRFATEVLEELNEPATLGLHLLFIPEEFNGLGGGSYDIYRISELMASIDLGISTGVLASFLGSDPITVGGTPDQKKRWMTKIADEALLVAYAATEPQAGSDLAALQTRATPVEENGTTTAYRINGRKQWISNGSVADLYTVLAQAPGGPTWFVVEKDRDGLSFGHPEEKHGIRSSNTASVYLDDVLVPVENLVGDQEGQGLAEAQSVFGRTRLMVGAFGLGAGWEALRRAITYSQERVQAGSTLSKKQGYTHKLIVPHASRLEAARTYLEWASGRLDNGEEGLATEGGVAKYLASEFGNAAAEDAIQALGGYGYTHEYMVEKIKRDVRITTIYEGTSEILEWTIARDRWQLHLKSRGSFYRDWAERLEKLHNTQPENGADIAAMGMRALSELLERCRIDRLTRQQHVLFRLGELIAYAEAAAVFSERVVDQPTEAVPLDIPARQALARIFARESSLKIAADGLRWAEGAGQRDPDLANAIGLPGIYAAQRGGLADMDIASEKLMTAFPA